MEQKEATTETTVSVKEHFKGNVMLGTTFKNIFKRKTGNQQNELTILYGSHSGNSEFIARETQKHFNKNGIKTTAFDLSGYSLRNLASEKSVLIVISTHGEGDPPDSAQKFYMNLFSDNAPLLNQLNFSVCALGDSSYEQFCKTGKDIDFRLEELGARRFYNRADCDVDFQKNASLWVSGILSVYQGRNGEINTSLPTIPNDSINNYQAIIKSKKLLNPDSSPKTYHIVLSVKDKSFYYQAGDSVRIIPENPGELVKKISEHLKAVSDTIITYEEKKYTLQQLLQKKLELTNLSKGLLERYQKLTKNEALQKLMTNHVRLQNYLQNCDVLDLITDFPYRGELQNLINVFRKIQPRYYSVASAIEKHPGEMHLIVKLVQTENRGRVHNGACSSYLNHWLEPGQIVNFRVVKNEQFRLPKDGSPLIMIAAGTGIAPFRAFLEEKETGKFNGDCWLIFGERSRKNNFFYQKEWEDREKQKLLNRTDFAFSRDQAEKIYVQHKISEQASEFFSWLNRGAHVYICGSVKMGKDVKNTIREVLQMHNKNSSEASMTWEKLVNEDRIHEDVY